MCGRFVLISPTDDLVAEFSIVDRPNLFPRYNIAPTTPVLVLLGDGPGVTHMRWGLIPAWVKDPAKFTLLINARSETVAEKPSFRNAFRRRRCIVPADGFYEWRRQDGSKQPYFIHRADGRLMAMAGIWESWMGPNGEEQDTVALLTTAANEDIAAIHDRMPVILERDNYMRWMTTPEVEVTSLADLLRPSMNGTLAVRAVSSAVNAVRNDGPELLEKVTGPEPTVPKDKMSVTSKPDGATRVPSTSTSKEDDTGQLDLF